MDGSESGATGDWQGLVKGLLKAEMKRRGLTYDRLVERMAGLGEKTTGQVLRTKVARGGFSAASFVKRRAMGAKSVRLDDD